MDGSATAVRDARLQEQYTSTAISLRELGRQHGLSAEGVRLILAAAGIKGKQIQRARKKVKEQQRREKQCQKRFGISTAAFNVIRDLDAAQRSEGMELNILRMWDRDRRRAAREGVEWKMNLQQYLWTLEDFGTFDNGSITQPEYQLGRLDESEGFTYSNSVWDTVERSKPLRVQTRKYLGLPQGVRREGKKFVAVVRSEGRYRRFGPFPSVGEASKAFQDGKSWSDGKGQRPSQMSFM